MYRPRFVILLSVLWFAVGVSLAAQSAEFLDDLMFAEEATVGDAAILILLAAGRSGDEDPAAATRIARERGWLDEAAAPSDSLTLGTLSFLMMRATDMSGGLGYRVFPGPRYATRELDYLGLLRGYAAPNRRLSGTELLQVVGNVMNWLEAES